jgi:pimeloyl-ACP methyl ester carboxylesterase
MQDPHEDDPDLGVLGSAVRVRTGRGNQLRYFDANSTAPLAVLLIHGARANAAWWLGVAPGLTKRYRVIAMELSGHGESDHSDDYSPQLWVDDVDAVLSHAGVQDPHVVGHSMGGRVATFAVARRSGARSLILVDSPFQAPIGAVPRGRPRSLPKRTYDSAEAAVAAFTASLGGSIAEPALVRLVANKSMLRSGAGWTWQFDASASQRFTDEALAVELSKVSCDVFIVRGERSPLVSAKTVAYVRSIVGTVSEFVVPGAYHNIPLDAPELCCELIEACVGQSEQRVHFRPTEA